MVKGDIKAIKRQYLRCKSVWVCAPVFLVLSFLIYNYRNNLWERSKIQKGRSVKMKYSVWLNRGEEDQALLTTEWSLRNSKILRPRRQPFKFWLFRGLFLLPESGHVWNLKARVWKDCFFFFSELLKTNFHNVKIIYSQTMPISYTLTTFKNTSGTLFQLAGNLGWERQHRLLRLWLLWISKYHVVLERREKYTSDGEMCKTSKTPVGRGSLYSQLSFKKRIRVYLQPTSRRELSLN